MSFVYPAIFHKEQDSYWVEFPDLIGCNTFGDNINDTMDNAQEALAAYLLASLEVGKEINPPSDFVSVSYDDGSFTTLVTCNINPYKDCKAVKKTLTIPSWLNDRAHALDINCSQVLQDALIQKIQAKAN